MSRGALARRAGRGAALLLILLVVVVGAETAISETAVQAAPGDSAPESNSLTVTQTSTMTLAPGIAPVAVTGVVINNGPDRTFVTAIDVEITSVTLAAGAAPGTCGPSDYLVLDTRMPVGQTLAAAGGSADFSGAFIGFNNTSTNQDACKSATVNLLYTVVAPEPSGSSIPAAGFGANLGLLLAIAIALLGGGTVMIGLARLRSRWRLRWRLRLR
jgi:hypothetical protein